MWHFIVPTITVAVSHDNVSSTANIYNVMALSHTKECCESHYGWDPDCVPNSFAKATPAFAADNGNSASPPIAQFEPLSSEQFTITNFISDAVPTNLVSSPTLNLATQTVSADSDGQFYPIFRNGLTICENIGTPSSYLSGDIFEQTKADCCRKFTFEWDYRNCLSRSASDSHLFASFNNVATNAESYYPVYRKKSCEMGVGHPSWMAGDYLAHNTWECCSNNFHTEDSLNRCYEMPPCADCPSDMQWTYTDATAATVKTEATKATKPAKEASALAASFATNLANSNTPAKEKPKNLLASSFTSNLSAAKETSSKEPVTKETTTKATKPTKKETTTKATKPAKKETTTKEITAKAEMVSSTSQSAANALESVLNAHKDGIDK